MNTGEWQTIGSSVRGAPIRILHVGRGPRKVLFIGGIHGDEKEGLTTTIELPTAFESAGLADTVTLTILEDANPDGRAANTRFNANGIDVNRNFPAKNFDPTDPVNGGAPLSEPEARAIVETVDRIAPALILVAHSWAGREFINFDGPAAEIAQRFSEASGLPVEESSAFAPTPGSLGSYFGRDRGIPVLTIEVLKGSDPEAVWNQLRPALLQTIGG
ncbi:M14 family zinc carboxypeptidase [Mycobacterium sp. GA-1285]|uniref:M14 family zinc carboxypeptidase n=1 Tax=Mycobacterium sp. GA-1285 TaxID=1772282 RepID=UPI001560DC0D|nr:M14 family zinc carboxypeptidase [Mycobacterium sp. GA-1285]